MINNGRFLDWQVNLQSKSLDGSSCWQGSACPRVLPSSSWPRHRLVPGCRFRLVPDFSADLVIRLPCFRKDKLSSFRRPLVSVGYTIRKSFPSLKWWIQPEIFAKLFSIMFKTVVLNLFFTPRAPKSHMNFHRPLNYLTVVPVDPEYL